MNDKPKRTFHWQSNISVHAGHVPLAGYLIILMFCGGFGVWAATAPIGEAAIAPGVVSASGQNVLIQHLEGGVVREVSAREGDRVSKGQPLVTIDPTTANAQLNRLILQYIAQVSKAARLEAERDGSRVLDAPIALSRYGELGADGVFLEQRKEFLARLARFEAEQEILRQRIASLHEAVVGIRAQKTATDEQLRIIQEETDRKRVLLDKGLTHRTEYSELLRAGAALVGQSGQMESQIASSATQLAEAEQQVERLVTSRVEQAVAELNAVRATIADIEEQIVAARRVLERTVMRSPVDGVVVRQLLNFADSVVRAGEPVMEILPTTSELIIDARVRPEDVDKVRIGQDAQMHFLALNARTTPKVAGEVFYVSADRLVDAASGQPYYAVRLKIAEMLPPEIKPEQVFPGSPVNSFIATGNRTFVEYILRPILDSFQKAFKEE